MTRRQPVHTDADDGQTKLQTCGYTKKVNHHAMRRVICTANCEKSMEKGGTKKHASNCGMEKQ